jgi:hypothetical protein
MKKMKVSQFTNAQGNKVKNQFIVFDSEFTLFQSYDSIIVKTIAANQENDYHRQVFLDVNKWDYSKTTGKYRNQFLGETKQQTEAKIKSGEYQLIDLN